MSIQYGFSKPDKIYRLANELNEISGIQAVKKAKLVCVEDENLNIYEFDLEKKKIIAEYGKGAKGDAEDIVVIGKTAYVLLAGKRAIYIYKNYRTSMVNPHKAKLKLDKKYDPEGMCFSKVNGCILVACKGDPEPKSSKRKVFAFDLQKKKLLKEPFFSINSKNLNAYQPGKTFNPSGIAIHPKTNDIYMIGSKSLKLIIRLDAKGRKILGEKKLQGKVFKQPEGITFIKNGDLVLACEAKDNSKAKIFKLTAK